MKAWEYVIHTAMLGTDKPLPGNADLPDAITEIAALIDAGEASDKETKFLQKAVLIYNYRQCGAAPAEKKDLPVNTAPPETQPYCSEAAAGILNDILNEDNTALLELWLSYCSENTQLLLPGVLPAVLDKALKEKSLQLLVIACSGNRGLWLSKLNPAWDYFILQSDAEIWQTGKPEERVNTLKKLRQTDPALAREWLQQTWAQETAASKAELLKVLKINRGPADLPWLESLLDEKGQKVKEEALSLLKHISGSSIVHQYENLLKQSVILKKEKALLGMMTKITIQQTLPAAIDESIFKSGIEKLAGQKASFTDEHYILYQLIGFVPPAFWETHFDATPAQVVAYFEKYAETMIGAVAIAVSRFGANDWIPYFLNQESKFYSDYLDVLPVAERDNYLLRFFKTDAKLAIHDALRCTQEWGEALALAAISEMAGRPYEYNRSAFSRHINLIPVCILNRLEKIEPKDINLQQAWEKNRSHLTKLLGLKQQTQQAFNA